MENRPMLLDLFCGAGGAAAGYAKAGFDVVGVDNRPMPRYPFPMVIANSLRPPFDLREFDAIHASPPCQAFSAGTRMWTGRLPDKRHPDLIEPVRELLLMSGKPYIIENVEGAPLNDPLMLCGDMFGLGVKRHRIFETNFFVWKHAPCRKGHPDFFVSVFGGGALSRTPKNGSSKGTGNFMQRRSHVQNSIAKKAMGIDWMTRDELSQAIPPAYTEFIGRQLMGILRNGSVGTNVKTQR